MIVASSGAFFSLARRSGGTILLPMTRWPIPARVLPILVQIGLIVVLIRRRDRIEPAPA